MSYYIYLMVSEEGYHYTGHTPDLIMREREHNLGLCHSTKHGHNWKIIYYEEFESRSEAMKREKWLKSGIGRKWIEKNVAGWGSPQAE